MPSEQLDGVTVDDPNEPDEKSILVVDDTADDPEISDDEVLRRALKPEPEDLDEEADEEDAEETSATPAASKVTEKRAAAAVKPEDTPRTFTQAELDRHISDRLAREQAKRERDLQPILQELQATKELLAATGKTPQELAQDARRIRVQQIMDQSGVDEVQANAWANLEEQNRRHAVARQNEAQQREAAERRANYVQQKSAFKAAPHVLAMARRYEDEIDALSQQGTVIDYETAARHVIGSKIVAGESLDAQRTAEQKAIREMNKRGRTVPITAGGSAGSAPKVTREQAAMARALGIDPADKEYLASLQQTERTGKLRRR